MKTFKEKVNGNGLRILTWSGIFTLAGIIAMLVRTYDNASAVPKIKIEMSELKTMNVVQQMQIQTLVDGQEDMQDDIKWMVRKMGKKDE